MKAQCAEEHLSLPIVRKFLAIDDTSVSSLYSLVYHTFLLESLCVVGVE